MNKVSGGEVSVLYIDYGNKETIPKTKCAALPSSFTGLPPFAKEYGVAFLALPPDVSVYLSALWIFQVKQQMRSFLTYK